MHPTRLNALNTFLQAIRDYLKINDEFRSAWRYQHIRDQLAEPRRQAFNLTETRRDQLHQLLKDNPDKPTYLDRQARDLITKWDNRTQNLEIYRHEPNGHNLDHLNNAEKALKKKAAEIIEVIKKTTHNT